MNDDEDPGWYGYTDEEIRQAREECNNMLLLWNAFSHHLLNTQEYQGMHMPPALEAIFCSILSTNDPLERVTDAVPFSTTAGLEALAMAGEDIKTLCDLMFRFGQFSLGRGVLHSDLTPCKCGTITDYTIEEFLKKPGGCS